MVLASAGNSPLPRLRDGRYAGRVGVPGRQWGAVGNLVDLFSLDGKVALVTGAGSGLGRQFSEVALFLASAARPTT